LSPDLSTPHYKIVRVASGAHSVHSVAHGETFHPVIGPVAEAEALYIRQTNLCERLAAQRDEFVIWDVGLGAAANPLTVLRAAEKMSGTIRFVSFDHTTEPLRFALQHPAELPFIAGFEPRMQNLLESRSASFNQGSLHVNWDLHVADFPSLIARPAAETLPKPHLVMFDAFSPAKNPAMWTLPLFARLDQLLHPARPCLLPTYSRSTLLRVTLLLAGFFVGIGHATGEKDETTIASNDPKLIQEPLDRRWLARARRSSSAEPLTSGEYRQAPLSPDALEKLSRHAQFVS
jgi:tRNA U34 5-methylaminomethyl-2-thiouridine-forming methyltransferase MnmC